MPKHKNLHIETLSPAMRAATQMRHRDFQRECILRGLPFKNTLEFDHTKLVEWFTANYDNNQSPQLLVEFDAFVEAELINRGYKKGDALLHPSLRFGYIPDSHVSHVNPETTPPPTPHAPKPPKPITPAIKKEKDAHGLVSGTKKSLTYTLAQDGKLTTKQIIEKVIESFPEAQESSIKIWIGRAKKEQNEKV